LGILDLVLKIISHILDFIFPLQETGKLIHDAVPETIAGLYQPGTYEGKHFIISYTSPLAQALIKENKYSKNTTAAQHLAKLLEKWLVRQTNKTSVILIPIPLSTKRRRNRGHNQVSTILKQLHLGSSVKINENILRRTYDTTPQTTLKRQERLANLKNAFSCDVEKLKSYTDCTFIIIDDVVTTGATLTEARAELATHLPPSTKIICLALAH